MASKTSSNPGEAQSKSKRVAGRRRWLPALSGIHLLIVVTGVLALVANLALLRRGEAPLTKMAVTLVDLAPGRNLQLQDIELTAMDVTEPVASGLVSETELPEYEGWVVIARMPPGSLLTKASLREPLTRSRYRAMSFPIDVEHAAGGDLIPGDLVDVIRVDEEEAYFVATGVPVLDVPGESAGALGITGRFYLILEVDERTALTLSLALAHAQVEVLRSTGSSSVTVRRVQEEGLWPSEAWPQWDRNDLHSSGSMGPGGSPPIGGD